MDTAHDTRRSEKSRCKIVYMIFLNTANKIKNTSRKYTQIFTIGYV